MRRVVVLAWLLGIGVCSLASCGCGKEAPAQKTNINLQEKGWLPPTAKNK
jgi:hypothetical protein